jgi:hypothetical protein
LLITKLRIEGQYFFLAEDADQEQLEREMVTAIRAGGDFVRFETHGHGRVSVLMTVHFSVRFEVTERTEDEIAGWVGTPPSMDIDPDSYFE